MINSMTAYGRGRAPHDIGFWMAEIKSVNGKYLDFHLRTPASLNPLEERIKKYVAAKFSRGRININITLNGTTETRLSLSLNKALLGEYKKIWTELETELGCGLEKPNLGMLVNNRDLVLVGEASQDVEELWRELEPALSQALAEAGAMRAAEGANLGEDLKMRLDRLEEMFSSMQQRSPQIVNTFRQRLNERISLLMAELQPDQERIAQEVAIMADRCDISEELVRATSHLQQFRGFLNSGGPVGRKLDFVVQELNREANTMGSKSPDASAQSLVVEIKAELEKIREQIQNIE